MAEGFEPYHVPQQSRRDKLRVLPHHHPSSSSLSPSPSLLCALDQPSSPSLTFYDAAVASSVLLSSSSSASDLLTAHEFLHRHRQQQQQVKAEEEAGVHNYLMGFVGASTSSSHHHHHPYLDPQSAALNLNPSSSSILENHNHSNPFLYNLDHQNLNSEVVLYKPEPLSLSLSSQHHHQNNSSSQLPPPPPPRHRPLELNLQRYGGSSIYGGGGTNSYVLAGGGSNEVSISTNNTSSSSLLQTPFGPFTGYASILKGSRFLKPAQQLLKEFCDVGQGVFVENINIDSSSSCDSFMDATPLMNLSTSTDQALGDENRKNKSRLISMLDEVCRRYKLYYQQMQAVVASFEYVAGLGDAAPFANLALKSMSKHFKDLKIAIADQLQFNNKHQFQGNRGKEEASSFGSTERGQYSWSHNSGLLNCQSHPVWRPQRGLPERAVTVLRAWLFEHFLHPYPNDTEKLMLAKQTGLSRSQVSNWFINARVRLWKPMVEEIHMLETRQCQKAAHREEQSTSRASNDHQLLSSSSLPSENPSTSTQMVQDTPSKRSRNDFRDIPVRNLEPPSNLSYNNLSNHPHVGVGVSMADGGGSSSVSLTLGLYQNNGIGLSQPYPISAAERFGLGLEASDEGFVLSGYEAQSRIFGRDVIGGQLLHDFVG